MNRVADTRAEVLDAAVRRASVEGLEGMTIGRLADELSMSKSGLFGLFGGDRLAQRTRAARADVRAAVAAGDLPAGTDPADVAFALYALASAASQAIQLDEPGATATTRPSTASSGCFS